MARTINGTPVKILRVMGSLTNGCAAHVMCDAHPNEAGKGFQVPVALADIDGGADAVMLELLKPPEQPQFVAEFKQEPPDLPTEIKEKKRRRASLFGVL